MGGTGDFDSRGIDFVAIPGSFLVQANLAPSGDRRVCRMLSELLMEAMVGTAADGVV